MKKDLINLMCGGDGRCFHGPCDHLETKTQTCALLKEIISPTFWKECRAVYILIEKITKTRLNQYNKGFSALAIDESNIKLENIINRLTGKKLQRGHNLAVMYQYLRKTVHTEIREYLSREGLIPNKKRCGTCKHISGTFPHTCSRDGMQKHKTDAACANYQRMTNIFISLDALSDEGENASKISYIERIQPIQAKNPEELLIEKDANGTVKELMTLLHRREKSAKIGTKKRKRYNRQYNLIAFALHLFEKTENVALASIVEQVATQYGINKRTVLRDFHEIRNLWKKKSASECLDNF